MYGGLVARFTTLRLARDPSGDDSENSRPFGWLMVTLRQSIGTNCDRREEWRRKTLLFYK